jgi:hypothetical protein
VGAAVGVGAAPPPQAATNMLTAINDTPRICKCLRDFTISLPWVPSRDGHVGRTPKGYQLLPQMLWSTTGRIAIRQVNQVRCRTPTTHPSPVRPTPRPTTLTRPPSQLMDTDRLLPDGWRLDALTTSLVWLLQEAYRLCIGRDARGRTADAHRLRAPRPPPPSGDGTKGAEPHPGLQHMDLHFSIGFHLDASERGAASTRGPSGSLPATWDGNRIRIGRESGKGLTLGPGIDTTRMQPLTAPSCGHYAL